MSDVPVPVVDQPKPVEVTEAAAVAAVEPTKTDETPAITETPAAVVEETPAAVTEETPAEDKKEDAKPAARPKSPGLLARLMGPFNKKSKGPKSPAKTKETETPVTEEASKVEETPAAAYVEPEAPKEVVAEPVKDTETPATETPVADVKEKDEKDKKSRFTRRLSTRVGDLFKKSKSEAPTSGKVDVNPPVLEEPTPVAPLENPASEGAGPAETPAEPSEPIPVEPVIAATHVVAAAA